MGTFVTVEARDAVAVIRIHRPPLNILNLQAQDELALAAMEIEADSGIRSAVLYGGGSTFAAGADIKEMSLMDQGDVAGRRDGLQHGFNELAGLSKPLVAAITGYALGGGCELALCADVRFAAEDAVLGQPEIRLGIMPGCGGTQRLARLVGPARAKDLMLTGRQVSAGEAYRIGLVDRVVPSPEVFTHALEWAGQFSNGPALALGTIKEAVDEGMDLSLADALELERELFAPLFATQDKRIGMQHFLSKSDGTASFVGN